MSYLQCRTCNSTDIDQQSGAMGVHSCNRCGSSSVGWMEGEATSVRSSSRTRREYYAALKQSHAELLEAAKMLRLAQSILAGNGTVAERLVLDIDAAIAKAEALQSIDQEKK